MVYTSIQTAGGWQTNTVTAAYDLLFRRALNAQPTCRQFIDVMPERPTHTGSSVTLQKLAYFSQATITAAKTPLTEESDVTAVQVPATTPVTLTPTEYGFGTVRTLKLINRSMVPLDPWIAEAVADHCAKTVDELLQDQMVTGTQVYRPNSRATTATVTQTDVTQAQMVRLAVTKLRANQAQPRDGQFYVGLLHPNQVHDLRQETGSGGWRVPNEYGANQGQIWNGEFGLFEGVRFVQNARLRVANDGATSTNVYRGFIMGREALAQAVVVEPEIRIGEIIDTLKRFRPVGWYGDFAFKVFRDEALVRFESATSAV